MNILVTAGNTIVPVDQVRCLTNIFTGRTGASLALEAHRRGHDITLLTSHPEAVSDLDEGKTVLSDRWHLFRYCTFEDLDLLMAEVITQGTPDAVVHCAAVSDYLSAGVYAPAPGTSFDPDTETWGRAGQGPPTLVDRAAGKVKSGEPELWLRLVRAPKLIDRVRSEWGFHGLLVKFKLEVGASDERLLQIAERSRQHSQADLMVANTLEGAGAYAYVGPVDGDYRRVIRRELAPSLLETLEHLHQERSHG